VEDDVDCGDFRENPFKGGEDDADQGPDQDLSPGHEKTMLIDYHQS